MTLLDLNVGQSAIVANPADADLQLQLIRLGLGEGACLTLVSKVPAGPLVFKCNGTEIALGREFCKHIPTQPKHTLPYSAATSA